MSRKSRNVIIGLALLIVLALVVFLITRPKQEDMGMVWTSHGKAVPVWSHISHES